jgi:hypothetical protein
MFQKNNFYSIIIMVIFVKVRQNSSEAISPLKNIHTCLRKVTFNKVLITNLSFKNIDNLDIIGYPK